MSFKRIQCACFTLICGVMYLFSPAINANEEAEIQQAIDAYQESPWELGVAAGYGMRSNPLVHSDDIPLYVVLDIAWFGERFFFDNGDLGLNIFETDKLSVNLIAHVNNERGVFEWLNNAQIGVQFLPGAAGIAPPNSEESLENDNPETPTINDDLFDDPILDPHSDSGSTPNPEIESTEVVKIPKRSFAVDGGLEIIYADVWGDLQFQALSDISLTHKGVELWASYAYSWNYGNWTLTPSIGFNWKSSNLLDYYYGVRNREANELRPAYQADSGFNRFARLSVSYHVSDHWGIIGVAEYETLSRSIRRSPIVNKDSIETLFIGIMYLF